MDYMSDTGRYMGILRTDIYGESNMWTKCQIIMVIFKCYFSGELIALS